MPTCSQPLAQVAPAAPSSSLAVALPSRRVHNRSSHSQLRETDRSMRRYQFLWQTIFWAVLCLLFLLVLYAGRTGSFSCPPCADVSSSGEYSADLCRAGRRRLRPLPCRHHQPLSPDAARGGQRLRAEPGSFPASSLRLPAASPTASANRMEKPGSAIPTHFTPGSRGSISSRTIWAPVISASRIFSRRTVTFLSLPSRITRTSRAMT